jgi:hypothetical protein
MTDRALVIGLDAYENDAWQLRAAVRDAVAFAKWVTAPGEDRATPETLTLLLSPHPDRPPDGVTFTRATENAIRRALFDHKTNGVGAERLWFFYAGHGLAPAGGAPDEAPVIVPADVQDLDFYRSNPIDLSSWIREMQVSPPQYQVYFVDACRGIVVSEDPVTAMKTLYFDLSKAPQGGQARQAVLCGTTAGQLANEQGLHGLFGGALLDGLQGTGPALEADAVNEEFVLTFGGLAAYAKRRIQLQLDAAVRANTPFPTQEPAESLFRAQSSLEIARFKEKPASRVRLFVEPEEATAIGTAGIRAYNEWKRVWERQAERPSPLGVPVEWDLSATVYKIEVEAQGFKNWGQKIEVIGPTELRAGLERATEAPAEEIPGPDGGLEGFTPRPGTRGLVVPPDEAGLAAGTVGLLRVEAHDRYARIEIFDAEGNRVEAAWQRFDGALPVGAYRIEVALPSERPVVRSVLVTSDEPESVVVDPDPRLTQQLGAGVALIRPHDGLAEPSEAFGVATMTHIGSLLAWAASAAQHEPGGHGQRLRAIGVEPVVAASPQDCFVRVLVGDAQAEPGTTGGFLESVIVEMGDLHAHLAPIPALAGMAAQWYAPVTHHESLTLQWDTSLPRRLPVPYLAGYVWTVIIARESAQRTEIHRYLDPVEPNTPFDDTIRLVEQNWRALESRATAHDDEIALLLGRRLDPLSLAVLGYRLAMDGRSSDIHGIATALEGVDLADAFVLAGLAEGVRGRPNSGKGGSSGWTAKRAPASSATGTTAARKAL